MKSRHRGHRVHRAITLDDLRRALWLKTVFMQIKETAVT
jgi:hypothetical protein